MVGTKQSSGTNPNDEDSPKRKSTTSKGVRKPYVKRACINCKNAHAACEPTRPCKRCINMGLAHECVDAERKKPNRRPRKKKTPEQNVVANEFVAQSAYPYMNGAPMMPGFTYGFPAYQPNQYAYPYQQYPMMMNSQQMNVPPPLYLHNRNDNNATSTNTSPPSPPAVNNSTTSTQTMNGANNSHMMTLYHPVYWSDPAMQNQYLNMQMGQPIPLGPSQKRKDNDYEDEVDSENDGELDDEMNVTEHHDKHTDGELLTDHYHYDVSIPTDFIIDSPPSPTHNTELTNPDDSLHTNSALALQQIPQPLQIHSRYPYNDMSLFDEPFSPTSPLHQRFRKQDDKDDNIIELITENAATMLEDHDTRNNNTSKLGSAMNAKNKRSGSTNTSLMRVEDAPWTQLLSDIFKDDNNGNNELESADSNNFLSTTTNGTMRKATLSQDQLEQLLKHVWEKQSSQSKEIIELKQELRRVLNELQNLKLSREDANNNGSTRTMS
jgi:hypothetical protein